MPSSRFNHSAILAAAAAALAFMLGAARAQQCPPIAAPASSGYHLLKTIPLGGEGRWDLLEFDSPTRRLFISRSTKVVVLDVDSGTVVGEIPDTQGVHGIALAPDLGRGFTSNGAANTVTIFDLSTLRVLGTVNTGDGPDAIVYDPASKRVFTMNGRGKNATAIDAATGVVAGTFPLGGKPEFAVADGEGHIYANLEDLGEQVDIDSRKLAVTARWPVGGCEEPSGLAIDRQKKLPLHGLREQGDGRPKHRIEKDDQDAAHRPRRRLQRLRSRNRFCVFVEWRRRRNAHRGARRFEEKVFLNGGRSDAAGRPDHGA